MSEWQDITGADTYFTTRAGAEDWAGLTSAQKQAYLTTGYNRLYYSNLFTLPTSPTVAQLVILKIAQSEMAWYFKIHAQDEDHRKGIQAQGTVSAGIVSESYEKEMLTELPIPPFVKTLLKPWIKKKAAVMIDIARDDDYSVNSTVPVSDLDLES